MIAFRPFGRVAYEKAVDDTARNFSKVVMSPLHLLLSSKLPILSMERKTT